MGAGLEAAALDTVGIVGLGVVALLAAGVVVYRRRRSSRSFAQRPRTDQDNCSKTRAHPLNTSLKAQPSASLDDRPARTSPAVVAASSAAYFAAAIAALVVLLHAMHSLRQLAGVAASMAGTGLASPLGWLSGSPPHADATVCQASAEWPGWAGIKHAFILYVHVGPLSSASSNNSSGDSYTQTGFNYSGTPQPSPGNPMGNPRYPGYTSSNGPNWVGFLTTKYNASRLQTYNLGFGGATVDSALVAPFLPTVLSLKDQVLSEFLPGYAGSSPSAPDAPAWRGDDSLFAVWIGINDIGNSYYKGAGNNTAVTDALNAAIYAVYTDLVERLYAAGARNFAFLTVPPVYRSPLSLGNDNASQALEKADIEAFNLLMADSRAGLAANLTARYPGSANAWVIDTNPLFGAVLDNPSAFAQTAAIKNTTAYCSDYSNGTPAQDTLKPACGVPVNQYFWLNSLHPTYPIHDVVAEQLAKALAAGPNVCAAARQ